MEFNPELSLALRQHTVLLIRVAWYNSSFMSPGLCYDVGRGMEEDEPLQMPLLPHPTGEWSLRGALFLSS